MNLGDAVVTGFSGTITLDATRRGSNKSATDLTFINPDGPSARIIDVSPPGYVWDGRLYAAPKTFDVLAKDVGQVFGVALDDQTPPNVYVAATSVFGLNIVGRGRDGLPNEKRMAKASKTSHEEQSYRSVACALLVLFPDGIVYPFASSVSWPRSPV